MQVVIVLSGMYVTQSEWIQKEIDIANGFKKPIIGVKPWGNQMIPRKVMETSKEVVGWNTESVVNAIRKYAL